MIKCNKCGAEVQDGALFCTECGAPLEQPEIKVEPVSPLVFEEPSFEGINAATSAYLNDEEPQPDFSNAQEAPEWHNQSNYGKPQFGEPVNANTDPAWDTPVGGAGVGQNWGEEPHGQGWNGQGGGFEEPRRSGQIGTKNKVVAGVLAILLGSLGIHKFYLGYRNQGLVMLLVTIFGSLAFGLGPVIMEIIGMIEGVMYLLKSDYDFYETYEAGFKPWF